MRVAVVGAGFSGLIWAERIRRQGYQIVVFEKAADLGGVWRSFANQGSRVQMVAADYDFWERPRPRRADQPVDFTPRDAIVAEARAFATHTGVAGCIRFSTEVVGIESDVDGATLRVVSGGSTSEERFDAVAVLPGTLTRPRSLPLRDEAVFEGTVARGVADDVDPATFAGRRVVIVGMGSYAIENAREALEHGAAHVTLVARSFNVVAPKVASLRIANRLVWKGQGVVDTLRAPYEALGRTDLLAKLQDRATRSQRTIPPISDLYFIAQRFGRLSVLQDEVDRALPGGVALASGAVLEADVLLGCIGFERTATADRLVAMLGHAELNGMFVDRQRHVAFNFEPVHGGMDADEGIPFASHLTITRTLADLFVYYLERPEAHTRIRERLPKVRDAAAFSGADYQALFRLVAEDLDARAIVLHHLAAKVARCERRSPEEVFLAENRADWARLCAAMGGDLADFPYPFSPEPAARRRLEALAMQAWSAWRRWRVFGRGSLAPAPPKGQRGTVAVGGRRVISA